MCAGRHCKPAGESRIIVANFFLFWLEMTFFGKGRVTKLWLFRVAVCVVAATWGVVSAAEEKDADYYYSVGDWKKVVDTYSTTLNEKSGAEIILRTAEASYHIGNLAMAEDLAKRALSADTVEARVLFSLIRAKKGMRDEALQELEAMLKKAPDDYRVLTALGVVNAHIKTETALSYLSKAVEKNPDYFPAWFEMGLIYEDTETFDDATKAYSRALEANPRSAQAHNNLGYSYKERHFYQYAVGEYLKATELIPDNAGYYYNLGNAFTHQEKIDDAFYAYKKALELDPKFAKAHYNMARTYLRKDMVPEAIDEFRLYLKYGDRAVFRFVASESAVEDEIEQLELYLRNNPPEKPYLGVITK